MDRRVFCTLGLLSIAACGSDRPTGIGCTDWLFSATISGSPDLIDRSGTAYVQDGHLLSIIGSGSIGINRRAIEVKAAGVTGPGSFDVTVGINRASYGETGPSGQYWVANFEQGSGTLIVTEYSETRVVASFSFTAYTDATLTNPKTISGTCVCRVQSLATSTR